MILNSYAVLDGFITLLRLGLGGLVVWLALSALWLALRHRPRADERKSLEDRCYLLFLLAGLLLGLNVVSWPIFYLLLQSYAPEWPGVMCIYGVTRIGEGSLGPSRFLPGLVAALQASKPVLVFLSGAWFVLYLVNRGTRTAPLTARILVLLLAAGSLGIADAAAESVYLVIPKKEVRQTSGCCTEAFDEEARLASLAAGPGGQAAPTPWLYAGYYTVNAGMILALAGYGYFDRRQPPHGWLGPLLLGAGLCLAVNVGFLIDEAAPRLLHLPYHHCPYDLVPAVPESLVAVALFLGGSFSVGWACVVGWLGQAEESRPLLRRTIGRLLHLGLLAYLGSLLMVSVELALA